MTRKLLILTTLGLLLSGCYMAPMALLGPATSGFSTASLIQAGVSSGANYMVKKSTGKTLNEHAIDVINKNVYKQTYLPKQTSELKFTKEKYHQMNLQVLKVVF